MDLLRYRLIAVSLSVVGFLSGKQAFACEEHVGYFCVYEVDQCTKAYVNVAVDCAKVPAVRAKADVLCKQLHGKTAEVVFLGASTAASIDWQIQDKMESLCDTTAD